MPRLVKPTGNARRKMSYADFGTITHKGPHKPLTMRLKASAGRDNTGRISVRHQSAGVKKLYRVIDFKMKPFEGAAEVLTIEYDPYRTAFIALIAMPDGEKRYMVAPDGLKVGDKVTSGTSKGFKPGCRFKLADIPVGYEIHNLELQPGRGGQAVRSAGASAKVTAKEGKYAYIKMPSTEIRKILLECMATIGKLSNTTNNLVRISKAGRNRLKGIRPSVRGKAMNPNSHPHGGGEGNNPIGLKYPKTPWGKPALGVRTRRNKRTNVFIVQRRKK